MLLLLLLMMMPGRGSFDRNGPRGFSNYEERGVDEEGRRAGGYQDRGGYYDR